LTYSRLVHGTVNEKAWREQWYSRNAARMTPETRERNAADLKGIIADSLTDEITRSDAEKALAILREQ
jgi:hypothetical protein